MEEIWKDIFNADGIYQISNYGKIRSLDRYLVNKNGFKSFYKGRNLITKLDHNGYPCVHLRRPIKKYVKIHRMVALTFIPNPENKPQVNHKDGNKLNNNVENLEWATSQENIRHAIKNGLKITKKGKYHHSWGKASAISKPVYQIDINSNVIIREFRSCTDAGKISKCCRLEIGRVARGERDSINGFKWEYKNP